MGALQVTGRTQLSAQLDVGKERERTPYSALRCAKGTRPPIPHAETASRRSRRAHGKQSAWETQDNVNRKCVRLPEENSTFLWQCIKIVVSKDISCSWVNWVNTVNVTVSPNEAMGLVQKWLKF